MNFSELGLGIELAALTLAGVSILMLVLHRCLVVRRRRLLHGNIEQLQVLRGLLADLQCHRGLSTGLLSGDKRLRQDVTSTCDRLDRSIRYAQTLDGSHAERWQSITRQWQAVRNVHGRDLAVNLMAHNKIIGDTIFLIEDIYAERDLCADSAELGYLVCIWREVVQTAEWSGQARALGTGIAATRSSSVDQRVRLRFLHQKIGELSDLAFEHLEQGFADTHKLSACREAVKGFLASLESELLSTDRPSIEAKQYFDQATGAINQLFGLVDCALLDLKRIHGA
ncbi:nitrate- and nitrite sensing domain-containing protein [Marinobacterium lutimaris]|uniref:Nitrate and nitrite sensing n=1 Tax=Marinobacterium lutimaris TaxID=568106 RepID=A0A1H5TVA9_9GAMM|nr:nitrate- and nitrite sensing domain-containing protein [Marinobacterium lutimaris]SEF66765.1 Nitrate and nitrite sensing [Marinobacterium lutimaris]